MFEPEEVITEEIEEKREVLEVLEELSEDEKIAGDELNYDALEVFSESEWEELVTEKVDPFDPTMNWKDLGDALEEF